MVGMLLTWTGIIEFIQKNIVLQNNHNFKKNTKKKKNTCLHYVLITWKILDFPLELS